MLSNQWYRVQKTGESQRGRASLVVLVGAALLVVAALVIASVVTPFPSAHDSGPRLAFADVGSISITSVNDLGGGNFSADGTWGPTGSQCWNPGQGGTFHYFIELRDDPDGSLPVTGTLLTTIDPAPCNGDYTNPVDTADRGL